MKPPRDGRARLQTMVTVALTCALAAGPWTQTPAAEGARILAVEPIGGRSHWNFMSGIVRALLARGHHVTAFTPFAGGPLRGVGGGGGGNYTEVDISAAVPTLQDADMEVLMRNWGSAVGSAGRMVATSRHLCHAIHRHPEMERLLSSSEARSASSPAFDLVLVEPLLSDCASYAARRLRVPLVYAVVMPQLSLLERLTTGHYPNPAVAASAMAGHRVPKTFVQRAGNAALSVYFEVARAYHDARLRRADPREFDSVAPVPPSLVFVNGHFASRAPGPASAEVVDVGGIHLTPPARLPEDILEFIEQSPHGVILFTFGSTVKMSTIPEHLKKAFIEALAQVPQRVLLKYENDMVDKPKNVMTMKWLPQRDILLHPNVKLFISHGGLSGLYETVDAGVPVLGFPLVTDQHRNIDSLVNAGMAISMDLLTVTKDTFLNNVLELLNNEKYTMNAKTASEIFKDRPLSAEEQVVYWTEYIIRHKGAPHLKSHAINLTWYQYYLLDVIGVVLISISIVFFITYKCLKLICKHVYNLLRKVKVKSE